MWLLCACAAPTPGPATGGSRSAELAARAGEVARAADTLARRTADIEGEVDRWRDATPAERAAIEANIRAIAAEVQASSEALRDQVVTLEEGARAWE